MSGQGARERPALVNIPVGGPFECVRMDFVEMDKNCNGNQYALAISQSGLRSMPYLIGKQKQSLEVCKVSPGGMEYPPELFMTELQSFWLRCCRKLLHY